MRALTTLLILFTAPVLAKGTMSPDIRITSDILGYDLQYRVYLPENHESLGTLKVLYVTDGQSYIRDGRMPRLLDRLIDGDDIEPVVVVFVDPRDPDNLRVNRRNQQFLCNADYYRFYADELIAVIEAEYDVVNTKDGRAILGLSFGATNAACFVLHGHEVFADFGMQSPANHPIPRLLPAFEEMPPLPANIFLSTGRLNDNTKANRQFRDILQSKGYRMKYVEVSKGHSWENWRPLLDDVLMYFYGTESSFPSGE